MFELSIDPYLQLIVKYECKAMFLPFMQAKCMGRTLTIIQGGVLFDNQKQAFQEGGRLFDGDCADGGDGAKDSLR
jgi:hypothetical protein